MDLAVILANSISNGIENVSSKNPFLEIAIFSKVDRIQIKVSNSVDFDVFEANPNLKTTKKNPKYHGFGTKSLISVSKKYNGTIRFCQSDDVFSCIIELPYNQ